MTRRALLVGFAALLGLVATALIAWSASRLASQRVGLAAEPLSISTELAPPPVQHRNPAAAPPASRPRAAPGKQGQAKAQTVTAAVARTVTSALPSYAQPATPRAAAPAASAPAAPVVHVAPSAPTTQSPPAQTNPQTRPPSGGREPSDDHQQRRDD